jgi:hypothetical protein
VVGDYGGELRIIMNDAELEACGKSVDKFESSIVSKLN